MTELEMAKASLRWALDWIEKCGEVPLEGDEHDDWLEFAAALDLLKPER